jgi:hypothetical protein
MATTTLVKRTESIGSADIERVLLGGDLSKLTPEQRLSYYNQMCSSLGLNPLTKPFEYIQLNGKLQLYARKDCTDQLRKIQQVSVDTVTHDFKEALELYVVTAIGSLPNGRKDTGTGAVSVKGLAGDALANAIMKAETKAKRRLTLSICGLGMLDESEIETIKNAPPVVEGLAPEEVKEKVDWILNAHTLEELKTLYETAVAPAMKIQDRAAIDAYVAAKNTRKADLQ